MRRDGRSGSFLLHAPDESVGASRCRIGQRQEDSYGYIDVVTEWGLLSRQAEEALGIKPGTRLVWHVLPDGDVIVRIKTQSIHSLART